MRWNKKVDRIFKLREENKKNESHPDIYADEYYNPDEDRVGRSFCPYRISMDSYSSRLPGGTSFYRAFSMVYVWIISI